jgi:S1-C subfamily serine protease
MPTQRRNARLVALTIVATIAWLRPAFTADPVTARLPDSVPETSILSNGTGFFVNASGTVVTARHVVQNCKKILVMKDRNLYPVRRAVISHNMDISLLFPVALTAQPAVIEADNTLHDGEPVYFLGDNALRASKSARPALFDAVVALNQTRESTEYLFQISGSAVPGYSGSPVLNAQGHVIGIILGTQKFAEKTRSGLVLGGSSSVESVTPVAIKKLLDANKVSYQTTASSGAQPNQLVAQKISVGVICIK